jgi:hypothetical protein
MWFSLIFGMGSMLVFPRDYFFRSVFVIHFLEDWSRFLQLSLYNTQFYGNNVLVQIKL